MKSDYLKNMSTEMKACYISMPWGKHTKIHSLEEWIEYCAYFIATDESIVIEDARDEAYEDYARILDNLKDMF